MRLYFILYRYTRLIFIVINMSKKMFRNYNNMYFEALENNMFIF